MVGYTIHFTEQADEPSTPFENKSFVLNDGTFIPLADTSGNQGLGVPVAGDPVTTAPNPFLLPGRTSLNWGEVINENILKLVEHQASFEVSSDSMTLTAVPQSIVNDTAIRGQVWYNLTDDHLYVYGNDQLWHRQQTSSDAALLLSDVVMKSGDTMTGFLTLHADPTDPFHAATKQYVDTLFGGGGGGVAASAVTFIPCGSVVSLNVQDALCELVTTVDGISGGPVVSSNPASLNYIINGDFQIWQRGNGPYSFAPSQTKYTSDRWRGTAGSEQSTFGATITREAHVGGEIADGEPTYYLKWNVTSAAGATTVPGGVHQLIENSKTLNSREATLSFWARSATSNSLFWTVTRNHGTGGSIDDSVDNGSFALTPTWTKYTATMTFPSMASVVSNDADSFVALFFHLGVNTTGEFDVSQVQLEPGGVAHVFLSEPPADQWTKCERYYQAGDYLESATGVNAFTNEQFIEFRTLMRDKPTVTGTFLLGGTSGVVAHGPATMRVSGFQTSWQNATNLGDAAPYVIDWRADAEL